MSSNYFMIRRKEIIREEKTEKISLLQASALLGGIEQKLKALPRF
jgi:hypothetical protein